MEQSNFPHKHNFVIQGWNGTEWQDSIYGSHSITLAEQMVEKELTERKFSGPNTKLRVVKACAKK